MGWGAELSFAEMWETARRTGLVDGNQELRSWTCEVLWDVQVVILNKKEFMFLV